MMKNFLIFGKLKRFPRKLALKILFAALMKKRLMFAYFYDSEQEADLKIIDKICNDFNVSLSLVEAYQLYKIVRDFNKIIGDIAEVGVYKGSSAKIICYAKDPNKSLHLFDTFGEGLPEPGKFDEKFSKGNFAISSFEEIKNQFKNESNVYFYKGEFPKTADPIKDKKFSFVHLDVDIYQSTKDCLEFFYPRMSKGGVILSHDYFGADGVKKAFDEFFEDKPEVIIKLSTSQCLVVKS